MNEDNLRGEGRDIGGKVQETAGNLIGDREMQADGIGNQIGGKAEKALGGLRDLFDGGATGNAPVFDRARDFARARPFASAALAGVVGIALLNTLRGKR